MRIFFDTEFMEDGTVVEPLSIGAVAEDGREFYAENAEADWSHANDWVVANVLPHLHADADELGPDLTHPEVMTRAEIAEEFHTWVQLGDDKPEFWAYFADYDWIVLCQLYGRMVDLPAGWPMFCMDVKQLAVSVGNPPLPPEGKAEHHALHDARWTRGAWEHLALNDVFCPSPRDTRGETVASGAENGPYVNDTVVIMTGLLQRIRAGWLPHAVGPERTSWYWGRPRSFDGFMLWAQGLVPSMSVVEPMTDDEIRVWTESLHPAAAELGDWCDVDGCPASICNGPHVSHHCPNGDLVVGRADDPSPCPFCGWTKETTGE